LRSLSVSPAEWSDYQARHRQRAFDPGLVAFLEVDPAATQTSTYVDERLSTLVGEPLAVEDLEQRIGAVYGRGNYQQIDYRLQRRNGERGVLVIPADKPWGPVYGRFGFQLDDDFEGRSEYLLSAEISATNINRFGAEWRNTLWIGRIGGVRSEFYQPFGDGASVHAMPYLMGRNEDVPVFDGDGDQQLSEYRIRRRMLGIELGWSPRSYWSVSGTLERGRDDGDLRIGDPVSFPDATADYSVLKAGLSWDSLDDAQFPASGSHVSFTYDMFRPFLGGDLDSDAVRMNADWVPRFGSHVGRYHLLLGLRLASALDDDQFFETQGFLGGFLNLSGYPERSLRGNQLAYGRAVLYRRTGRLDKIFSTPFYIGASLEAGNAWANKDDVALDSLRYGGSLFIGLKTPLGPVFFGYGLADEGRDAVYLTFGSLLRPVP
jgi:NTE family protein